MIANWYLSEDSPEPGLLEAWAALPLPVRLHWAGRPERQRASARRSRAAHLEDYRERDRGYGRRRRLDPEYRERARRAAARWRAERPEHLRDLDRERDRHYNSRPDVRARDRVRSRERSRRVRAEYPERENARAALYARAWRTNTRAATPEEVPTTWDTGPQALLRRYKACQWCGRRFFGPRLNCSAECSKSDHGRAVSRARTGRKFPGSRGGHPEDPNHRRAVNRAWRLRNPERLKEHQRRSYEAHREEYALKYREQNNARRRLDTDLARLKRYLAERPEQRAEHQRAKARANAAKPENRERARRYREAHRERAIETSRQWREEHAA